MSISEYIRELFLTCPQIETLPIAFDYLSDTPSEAAIEAVAVPKTVKTYTDGQRLMKYEFILSLRLPWFDSSEPGGGEIMENVCSWAEEVSDSLPPMPNSLKPVKLSPSAARYSVDGKNSSARYQAVFELYYLKP